MVKVNLCMLNEVYDFFSQLLFFFVQRVQHEENFAPFINKNALRPNNRTQSIKFALLRDFVR